MTIEHERDVVGLKRIGAIVAKARDAMGSSVRPGITTDELNAIGKEILDAHGARSAPQLAYGFPRATCISVNDAIAHGIPSDQVLRVGDVVNVDVSAELDGYWADTGASFGVGQVTTRHRELLKTTRAALNAALAVARAGVRLRQIGQVVEQQAKRAGFAVVRELCGHGVGRFIHEPPNVPNTTDWRDRTLLTNGLVIAIEPFLTTRASRVVEDADGWTLRTPDGSVGAQFEHTVIITQGQPIVVTAGAAA